MYKVLDLFCGAGGASLGFENAGFEIIGGVDFDVDAIKTHTFNFKKGIHYCGDIKEITNEYIEKNFLNVDVIVGGPPCQGFSSANRRFKEESDPRNGLFFEYMRFLKLIKPKVFVIENVQGLLTKDGGYAKDKIIFITEELGYKVKVKVLNAEDFGVPQKRKRAFFVGVRKDIEREFSFENLKPLCEKTSVFDAIGDLVDVENGKNYNTLKGKEKNWLQEYYCDEKAEEIKNYDRKVHKNSIIEKIKTVPQGGNWRDVPEHLWETKRSNRHSSVYRRLNFREPSITIDTGHGNYFHPIFNRVPNVRESARIQSFKDSFEFLGSKTSQYRQVGNAVPPILAQVIAIEILTVLDK